MVLVRMREEKRPQRKQGHRRKNDNNQVDFNSIGYESMEWINLVKMGISFWFLRI
jgi:hypothetical protein